VVGWLVDVGLDDDEVRVPRDSGFRKFRVRVGVVGCHSRCILLACTIAITLGSHVSSFIIMPV
jgi:hypothetical protein